MKRLKIIKVNAGPCLDNGLHRDDYLDTYNGIPLESSSVLAEVMREYAGQIQCLKVIRGFKFLEIDLPAGRLGIDVEQGVIDENILFLVQNMQISTTPFIPGAKLVRSIDIVTAECVFGMNILKDFFTAITDVFGGRSDTAQKVLRDARKACLDELRLEAAKVGANAIVGIDLDYSEFSGQGKSMLFLVASGTAVLVEPNSEA